MGIENNFDPEDFKDCMNYIGANHDDPHNKFVYEFFRNTDPEHEDSEKTFRKFVFLDKIYSAGLANYMTRTPHLKPSNDKRCTLKESYHYLARKLHEKRHDEFMEIVNGTEESPISFRLRDKDMISKKVNDFAKLIKDIMGIETNPGSLGTVSFSSKYLHFHLLYVPIFDSRACRALNTLSKGRVEMTTPRKAKEGQKQKRSQKKDIPFQYAEFLDLFIEAARSAYDKDAEYTTEQIKNLDGYLYYSDRGDWLWPFQPPA